MKKSSFAFVAAATAARAVFSAASATATPSATPTATPILPLINQGPVRVALEQIAGGLSAPLDFETNGDGRFFVVEQMGKIRLVRNGALVATPFLDASARIVGGSDERGLLGLAFHPGYNNPSSRAFGNFTPTPAKR